MPTVSCVFLLFYDRIIFTGSSWRFPSCRPDEAAERGTESQSCKDMCQSFTGGSHIWPVQTHSDILSKKLDKVYLALTGNVCVCVCSSCQRASPWVWHAWQQLTCLQSGPARGSGRRRSWRCAPCSCLQSRSLQSRTPTRPRTESRSRPSAWAAPALPPRSCAGERERKRGGGNAIRSATATTWLTIIRWWKAPSVLHLCDITRQGCRLRSNVIRQRDLAVTWSHSRRLVCPAKLPRRRTASAESPQRSSRRLSWSAAPQTAFPSLNTRPG